jgi:hypothetical protein
VNHYSSIKGNFLSLTSEFIRGSKEPSIFENNEPQTGFAPPHDFREHTSLIQAIRGPHTTLGTAERSLSELNGVTFCINERFVSER